MAVLLSLVLKLPCVPDCRSHLECHLDCVQTFNNRCVECLNIGGHNLFGCLCDSVPNTSSAAVIEIFTNWFSDGVILKVIQCSYKAPFKGS